MRTRLTATLLGLSAPLLAISAAPAQAATQSGLQADGIAVLIQNEANDHGRRWRGRGRGHDRYERGYDRGYGYDNDRYDDRRYDDRVYRDTQVWEGDDGRYYCRRRDGTTGLIVGGAAGALLGREVAGYRGDRTLGALLGAVGGALIGREIDRGGSRCR